MKKITLSLVGSAFLFIFLMSGCTKEDELKNTTNPKQTTAKMFEMGKSQADAFARQNFIFDQQTKSLKLVDSTVSISSEPASNINKASTLKSSDWGYPGQMYRIEYYTSAGILAWVAYFYYESNGRMYQEVDFNVSSSTGKFTFAGAYIYTYKTDYPDCIDQIYYYNSDCVNTYYIQYAYYPETRVAIIAKYDLINNTFSTKDLLYPSGNSQLPYKYLTYSTSTSSAELKLINNTTLTYNYTSVAELRKYDTNGSLSYSQICSYSSMGELLSMSASSRYNGEHFTYYLSSPDVVCYSNLKSNGSFNSAKVYRYDTSLQGKYDPLNPGDFHNIWKY